MAHGPIAAGPILKYDWPQAWLLFVAGATLDEVGELLNIPYHQMAQYSRRHLWRERRLEAQQRAHITVKRDLAKRIETHRIKHQHFILNTLDKTQEVIEKIELDPDHEDRVQDTSAVLSLTRQHDDLARRTLQLDEQKNNDPVAMGFQVLIAMQDPQNTCLATSIPPEPSDHSTGIIRPFNGHNNAMPMTPIMDNEGQNGEAYPEMVGEGEEAPHAAAPNRDLPTEPLSEGVKPVPLKLKFKYPQNPVNEKNESREET